ncbi:MAG: hypothetical protein IJW00_04755 [Clostridia bacterium]|nr:hypothetical protein [Clostridia bacterium]
MKTILKRTLCLLLCVATLMTLTVSFAACGEKAQVMMTLGDISMTENQFHFLLSRAKAAYESAGFTVTDWDTYIDLNETTYDTYVRQQVLHEAKLMMAGVALFEELGLRLPDATMDAIDKDIDELIEYHGEGSKSELNNILSAYGFNVNMLKEQYIFEAKYEYVQTHLYGENGSKLADSAAQEYLGGHAVAFKQLLIRSYKYVYETDLNGDEIYYLTDENDGQTSNIAYDTINGYTRKDEFDKVITDKNGDKVYYLSNGDIAYDKKNGVRAVTYDKLGNPVTEALSKEELAENLEIAESILNSVKKGDFAGFEAFVNEYVDSGEDKFLGDNELCFLYTTGDNGYDYLNDIADTLAEVEIGEAAMIKSEYGYNVVMKYAIPSDAVSNTEYKDWFTDIKTRVVQYLFYNKCKDKMDAIVVDEAIFGAMPKMGEISPNYNY